MAVAMGEAAENDTHNRFYDEYLAVMDITAKFTSRRSGVFLKTVKSQETVFPSVEKPLILPISPLLQSKLSRVQMMTYPPPVSVLQL